MIHYYKRVLIDGLQEIAISFEFHQIKSVKWCGVWAHPHPQICPHCYGHWLIQVTTACTTTV